MNRRDFLFSSGAGVIGLTVLSPLQSIGQALSPKTAISGRLATRTPVWLKRFDGASTWSLMRKRRFRLLMEGAFAGMSAPFWWDLCIHYTMRAYMSKPHYVIVQRNRYVVATGTMNHCAANRAMLWVDTRFNPATSSVPRAVLAVLDAGTSGRQLWLIDNHVAVTGTMSDIPRHLRQSISKWLRSQTTFRRLEGGRLQKVTSLDRNLQAETPNLKAYGIPLSRCEPALRV